MSFQAGTPATCTTNAQGRCNVSITATTVGTFPVTASFGGISLSTNLTFAQASANTSTVVASPASVKAGQQGLVIVTIRDAQGAPIAGDSVSLSIQGPTGAKVINNPPGTVTNASGVITFTVTSPNAGVATLSAFENLTPIRLTGTMSFTDACNPNPCAAGMLCTQPNGVAVCTCAPGLTGAQCDTTASVQLQWNGTCYGTDIGRDARNSAVITKLYDPNTQTSKVTLDGIIYYVSGTYGYGTYELPPGLVPNQDTPVSCQREYWGGNTQPPFQKVGGDASGFPNCCNGAFTGVAVTPPPSASYHDAVLSFPDKFWVGAFYLNCTWTTAETNVASATAWTQCAGLTVSATPGVVSAPDSTLTASPDTVPADGTTPAPLTLTARDVNGNPVAGQAVTMSWAGVSSDVASVDPNTTWITLMSLSAAISTTTGTTDANGQFTTSITGSRPGVAIVTAAVGGKTVYTAVTFQ